MVGWLMVYSQAKGDGENERKRGGMRMEWPFASLTLSLSPAASCPKGTLN
jgi:hypothetical protein